MMDLSIARLIYCIELSEKSKVNFILLELIIEFNRYLFIAENSKLNTDK